MKIYKIIHFSFAWSVLFILAVNNIIPNIYFGLRYADFEGSQSFIFSVLITLLSFYLVRKKSVIGALIILFLNYQHLSFLQDFQIQFSMALLKNSPEMFCDLFFTWLLIILSIAFILIKVWAKLKHKEHLLWVLKNSKQSIFSAIGANQKFQSFYKKYCSSIKFLLLVSIACNIMLHVFEIILYPKNFLAYIPFIIGTGLAMVIFELIRKGSRFGLVSLCIISIASLVTPNLPMYLEHYPKLQNTLLIAMAILSGLHLINFFYMKRKLKIELTEDQKKSISSLITTFIILYLLGIAYTAITTTNWTALTQVSPNPPSTLNS